MLTIGKLLNGQYYVDSVARSVEDYYAGHGEAPGAWTGSGAAALGLSGQVAESDLGLLLLAGCAPDGNPLVSGVAAAKGRLPGYDLTFSAPKSVTLMFAEGDAQTRDLVRAAHDAAVAQALGYMEAEALRVRRGRGGVTVLEAEGFVAAGFRHRTSRAGDPQLHTHTLVMNVARGSDGVWSAVDGKRLWTHARTAGFLYQAALRGELTRALGVEWGPVHTGQADVAGFTRTELAEFSKRRAEIQARMLEAGTSSARGAQAATLATRRAKAVDQRIDGWANDARDYHVEPTALVDVWRQAAAAIGLDETVIASRCGTPRVPSPIDPSVAGRQMLAADGLTHRASSFDRRDVLRTLAEQAGDGAKVAELTAVADRFLSRPDLVVLDEARLRSTDVLRVGGRVVNGDTGLRYTTPDLLAVETAILDRAAGVKGTAAGLATPEALAAAVAARPSLGADQVEMVTRLTRSGDGVEVVVGKAGCGKTFAMDGARAAWEASGMTVLGAALSKKAANELSSGAGIEATTIARLLADIDRPAREGGGLPAGAVLIVDEASMVGTRTVARLVEHVARAGGKLVLVGDPRQLPEIDAGGAFRGLGERLGAIYLTENRRQREGWERDALDAIRAGRVDEAVTAYGDRGRIHLAPTAEAAMAAMCSDWWQARQVGEQGIMMAGRREAIASLNTMARLLRVEAGELAGPELVAGGRPFAVGEEVVGTRNDRSLRIANGDIGTVTAVDLEARTVTVTLAARRSHPERDVLLPEWYVERHLDHAYALTVYKAEGTTTSRTFCLGDDRLSVEEGYTELSRGTTRNDLYWVASEPAEAAHVPTPDSFDQLRRALSTSRAQQMATESLGEVAALATDWTVGELEAEAVRLGVELRRAAPADRSVAIGTEREWLDRARTEVAIAAERARLARGRLAGIPRRRRADRATAAADVNAAAAAETGWRAELAKHEDRLAGLAAAQQVRQAWIDDHGPDIHRWAQLHEAATRRTANLVRVATHHYPAPWLTDQLGPYPDGRGDRRHWRDGARAVLVYRDRYNVTDRVHALGPEPVDPMQQRRRDDVARQVEQVRHELDSHTVDRDPRRPAPTRHPDRGIEPDRGIDLGIGL